MNLSNQKILITGGSSGIGLELSKELLKKNNKVIICGSTQKKLEKAKALLPQLEIIQCDLSKEQDCNNLIDWVKTNHPDLNVLINNAAIVHKEAFLSGENMIQKAEKEFQINFLSNLRLIKGLQEILIQKSNAAIINVTTGLVYAPRADYSFYNSTKAALHAFTQVLRIQNTNPNLKIIEVLFPVVDTPWHKGNAPKIAISVDQAVQGMIKGIEKGKEEVKVAGVKLLYLLSRIAPKFALKKINNL